MDKTSELQNEHPVYAGMKGLGVTPVVFQRDRVEAQDLCIIRNVITSQMIPVTTCMCHPEMLKRMASSYLGKLFSVHESQGSVENASGENYPVAYLLGMTVLIDFRLRDGDLIMMGQWATKTHYSWARFSSPTVTSEP